VQFQHTLSGKDRVCRKANVAKPYRKLPRTCQSFQSSSPLPDRPREAPPREEYPFRKVPSPRRLKPRGKALPLRSLKAKPLSLESAERSLPARFPKRRPGRRLPA
jgi:hypothetical protein